MSAALLSRRSFTALTTASLLAAGLSRIAWAQAMPEAPEAPDFFAGGTGAEEDPFLIETAEQLVAFADSVNDGSMFGYFGQFIQLAADIDLKDVAWIPAGNMADMETFSTFFMGTFDGDGHTISNLVYESEDPIVGAGLFGVSMGMIRNVKMADCKVSVTSTEPMVSQAHGIVVGYNMGGMVDGCSVKDSQVCGLNCVGGVAGGSGGVVTNCTVENVDVTLVGDNDFTDGIKQCDVNECGGLIVGGAFGGTVSGCKASGTITSDGNEPVGLGGIAGCLEMMNETCDNVAEVTITTSKGGHAIGGLCGYAGTHPDPEKILEETGVELTGEPESIHDCEVTATIVAPEATHVGGLVGTGLYYFGEETVFAAKDCKVTADIEGAITPGALFGRAEGCTFEDCEFKATLDGEELTDEIGQTEVMYESLDQ